MPVTKFSHTSSPALYGSRFVSFTPSLASGPYASFFFFFFLQKNKKTTGCSLLVKIRDCTRNGNTIFPTSQLLFLLLLLIFLLIQRFASTPTDTSLAQHHFQR